MSAPDLERLLPVLKKLREDTADTLARFFAKSDPEATYTAHQHAMLMRQLDDAIKVAERRIPWAMQMDVHTGVIMHGPEAIRNVAKMIVAGEKHFGASPSGLRLDVGRIMSSSTEALMHRHARSAVRYAGRVGASIKQDMLLGVVKGEGVGQIARRLLRGDYQRTKGDPEKVGEAIARKQFFRNQADAERLVRTEMNHAYNYLQDEALDDLNEDDPGWGKMWDATKDRRTCPECYAMHGEVRPVNVAYSCGVMFPPLHPNDRCSSIPWRLNWPRDKFAGEYREEKIAVRGLDRAARKIQKIEAPVDVDIAFDAKAEDRLQRARAKLRAAREK